MREYLHKSQTRVVRERAQYGGNFCQNVPYRLALACCILKDGSPNLIITAPSSFTMLLHNRKVSNLVVVVLLPPSLVHSH